MQGRTLKAKFTLIEMRHRVSHDPQAVAVDAEFAAFIGKDGDNVDWSKYTPSGKIEMCITNPAAIEMLDLGADYELTFTKV